jgi:hypothetical protein
VPQSLNTHWRIGVPSVVWTWGPPATFAAAFALVWNVVDSDPMTLQVLQSQWEMGKEAIGALIIYACLAGRWEPRLAATGAIGCGAVAISYGKVMGGWILIAAWLFILGWHATAVRRQRRVAQTLLHSSPPAWSADVNINRAALPGLAGRVIAVLCLLGVVIAGPMWAQKQSDFAELAQRAATTQGTVQSRDGDFTNISVGDRTYEFYDLTYRDAVVGQRVQVWVDPLGEHRPWGPDDADPSGHFAWLLAASAGFGGLILASGRYLVRRRAIARLLTSGGPTTAAEIYRRPADGRVQVRLPGHGRAFASLTERRPILPRQDAPAWPRKTQATICGLNNDGSTVLMWWQAEDGEQMLGVARLVHPLDFDVPNPWRDDEPIELSDEWQADCDEWPDDDLDFADDGPYRSEPPRVLAWAIARARVVGSVALAAIAVVAAWFAWWICMPDAYGGQPSWIALAFWSVGVHTLARMTWRFTRYGVRIRDGRALLVGPHTELWVNLASIQAISERHGCLVVELSDDDYVLVVPAYQGSEFAAQEVKRWADALRNAQPVIGASWPPVSQSWSGWVVGLATAIPMVAVAVIALAR